MRARSISDAASAPAPARPRATASIMSAVHRKTATPRCSVASAFSARAATPRSSSSAVWTIAQSTRPGNTDRAGSAARTWPIIVSSWSRSAPRSSATNERVASTRP